MSAIRPIHRCQQRPRCNLTTPVIDAPSVAPSGGVAVACSACQTAIDTEYFDVNGHVVCDRCRAAAERAAETPTGIEPLIVASVLGLGAALAGALIYYAVIAIAHLQIGYVAILIGYMVGYAVRKGARSRGGRRFQILAVALTYFAICLAYTPIVVKQAVQANRATTRAAAPGGAAATPTANQGRRHRGFFFPAVGVAVRPHIAGPGRVGIAAVWSDQRLHHLHRPATILEDDRRAADTGAWTVPCGQRRDGRIRVTPVSCVRCGTELPPGALACPACAWLTHGDALKALAVEADLSTRAGSLVDARNHWTTALGLLPAQSQQHALIRERVAELTSRINAAADDPITSSGSTPWWHRGAPGIATVALVMLSKVKFLLLGLTKASTLISMFAFFGVYWSIYGWPLALGLVVSIYIHEMGHVAMLRRLGIGASAPMFIRAWARW
jgi:hypothetical protein